MVQQQQQQQYYIFLERLLPQSKVLASTPEAIRSLIFLLPRRGRLRFTTFVVGGGGRSTSRELHVFNFVRGFGGFQSVVYNRVVTV